MIELGCFFFISIKFKTKIKTLKNELIDTEICPLTGSASRIKCCEYFLVSGDQIPSACLRSVLFYYLQAETCSPAEGEERTPGRLQAVWPPLKEEKVGLKYTEAGTEALKKALENSLS